MTTQQDPAARLAMYHALGEAGGGEYLSNDWRQEGRSFQSLEQPVLYTIVYVDILYIHIQFLCVAVHLVQMKSIVKVAAGSAKLAASTQ